MTPAQKSNLLAKVAAEIKACKNCQEGLEPGLAVPGEGNSDAAVVFVGEAPGSEEAKTGRPFIGRSGKLLTRLLAGIGIDRRDVFITSVCKYFPGRRAPTSAEIDQEKPFLLKQLQIIDPQIVVLLGNTAIKGLLGGKEMVTRLHGKIVEKDGRRYFVTFHPAAAVRFKKHLATIENDFKTLSKILVKLGNEPTRKNPLGATRRKHER